VKCLKFKLQLIDLTAVTKTVLWPKSKRPFDRAVEFFLSILVGMALFLIISFWHNVVNTAVIRNYFKNVELALVTLVWNTLTMGDWGIFLANCNEIFKRLAMILIWSETLLWKKYQELCFPNEPCCWQPVERVKAFWVSNSSKHQK
jgi:hypothetical protein